MALTPNDVLNKQFGTTKFRDGYDQDEVDDFLDEVLAEFQRLIAENERLSAELAKGGTAAPAAATGPAPVAADSGAGAVSGADMAELESLRSQLEAARAEIAKLDEQLTETKAALQVAQESGEGLDGMGSAEYLQLARRVHEEHVREGVAKRDAAIAEGETKAAQAVADAEAKASQLVSDAEAQASTLTTEAQAKADALLAEAQTARDTQLGELGEQVGRLETQRDGLQRRVDELQEFERSYRDSLKRHLEEQLTALDATAVELPPQEAPTSATGGVEVEAAAADASEPPTGGVPAFDQPSETVATGEQSAVPAFTVDEDEQGSSAPGFGGN